MNSPLRNTKEGQSIVDYLLQLMPNMDKLRLKAREMVDPLAARTLFTIWKNEDNKIASGMYRRPSTISNHQVEAMTKAGLIKDNGGKIEITEKGAAVIRVMVLGDNSSIFDKSDDRIIDYAEALKTTKNASRSKGRGLSKKASADWWDRFE